MYAYQSVLRIYLYIDVVYLYIDVERKKDL